MRDSAIAQRIAKDRASAFDAQARRLDVQPGFGLPGGGVRIVAAEHHAALRANADDGDLRLAGAFVDAPHLRPVVTSIEIHPVNHRSSRTSSTTTSTA